MSQASAESKPERISKLHAAWIGAAALILAALISGFFSYAAGQNNIDYAKLQTEEIMALKRQSAALLEEAVDLRLKTVKLEVELTANKKELTALKEKLEQERAEKHSQQTSFDRYVVITDAYQLAKRQISLMVSQAKRIDDSASMAEKRRLNEELLVHVEHILSYGALIAELSYFFNAELTHLEKLLRAKMIQPETLLSILEEADHAFNARDAELRSMLKTILAAEKQMAANDQMFGVQ